VVGGAVFVTSGITMVGEATGGVVGLGTISITWGDAVGVTGSLSQAAVASRSTVNVDVNRICKICFMVKNHPF
jgi:hypothetical protein